MTDDHPSERRRDDIPIRAVRAAIDMLAGDYAPLTRTQVIVSAHIATYRALLAEPGASETAVCALAHAALVVERNDARNHVLRRAQLVGGIERLPQRQQVVLSLKIEHDLTNIEIAAVLRITAQEVKVLLAQAFAELLVDPHEPP